MQGSIMASVPRKCRYGADCRNSNCRFGHFSTPSSDRTMSRPRKNLPDAGKMKKGICRYGDRCTRPDCWFDHSRQSTERKAIHQTSFEIGGSSDTLTSSSSPPQSMPYRFCSRQECEERQALQQISRWEATRDSRDKPQNERILDPCVAISRYRRSAAGSDEHKEPPRSRGTLQALMTYFQQELAPVCNQFSGRLDNNLVEEWSEFMVDRLRGCQSEATRLFDGTRNELLPCAWHVQMIRILLWVQYWAISIKHADQFMHKTLSSMLSTAFEHYWGTRQSLEVKNAEETASQQSQDDEVLCYYASSTKSTSSILLEYTRRVPRLTRNKDFPLFRSILQVRCQLDRQEYHSAMARLSKDNIPVLARCAMAKDLSEWRFRQCQQYNTSFAKEERVTNLGSLLHMGSPSLLTRDFVTQYLGLPIAAPADEEPEEDSLAVFFKQVSIDQDPPSSAPPSRDDKWVFGALLDASQSIGLNKETIQQLLVMHPNGFGITF